jgi:hypothetical protein
MLFLDNGELDSKEIVGVLQRRNMMSNGEKDVIF